jgi:hypothetical protein
MIAFESMMQVNQNKPKFVPTSEWNWKPDVRNPQEIDKSFIEASGDTTTSRETLSGQMDHGEAY